MTNDVAVRIRGLFTLTVLAFVGLLAWQSYWHLGQVRWLQSMLKYRAIARGEASTPRGAILDRAGVKLAWTEHGTRRYADGRATAAVLGYHDPLNRGNTNVEQEWDAELTGYARKTTPEEVHRILRGEPRQGKDVVLTLDLGLQRAAYTALRNRKGAVVVLDPATGGILAMATCPTFDPAALKTEFAALRTSDDGALRNRAVQDLYPPGSTMKLVTAVAALTHGVDATTAYTCAGTVRVFNVNVTDFHGEVHGTVSMPRALAESCNNYFARTAAALAWPDLRDTAAAFGFGTRWWEGEKVDSRLLPLPLTKTSLTAHPEAEPPQGERAHMGFGQSTVVATPLQMAMVAGAIANRGTLMAPFLVQAVRRSGDTASQATFASAPLGFPLDAATADAVAGMMRGVVTGGTARGADVAGLTVYGKTGTAEVGKGEDHAWFVGFAERKADPARRVAFAVLIEHGGTGGRIAMPVAREVLQYWARGE
jgi:peptidoglycan glycosyltransferase